MICTHLTKFDYMFKYFELNFILVFCWIFLSFRFWFNFFRDKINYVLDPKNIKFHPSMYKVMLSILCMGYFEMC